jgi:hypothetical protein
MVNTLFLVWLFYKVSYSSKKKKILILIFNILTLLSHMWMAIHIDVLGLSCIKIMYKTSIYVNPNLTNLIKRIKLIDLNTLILY